MSFERLPDSTVALAVELRDRALGVEPLLARLPLGTPVSKVVSGGTYWYLQSRGGGLDVQRYLGPESPELLARLAEWKRLRAELAPELDELARLNEMAVAGGVPREPASAVRALELLAAGGLFRAGALLVGTRAFAAYGPLLGFRAPLAARTQDVDVALPRTIEIALPRQEATALAARLGETEPPFLPVPELDSRRPSTSFKLRGQELRVDFLTPRRRGDGERSVPVPALGLAAAPLEMLDYLVAAPVAAVLSGPRPVLVRVPDPARFALHKLWLAAERSTQEAARARKDREQAAVLLELLTEERPRDLKAAARELARRPRPASRARAEARRLPSPLGTTIVDLLRP